MELIERYLQAIGRSLPATQRADILSELRSSLYDAVEDAASDTPNKAAVVALIKQMGPPEQVAAAYYPARQYLIGPALYPLFRTVVGITFTVIIGLQLFVVAFELLADTSTGALLNSPWEIANSLLMTFGTIVLIFWALQQLDVKATDAEEFNPLDLPALTADSEAVSRNSHIFSIIINVVILVIFVRFAQHGGFTWIDGRGFFENPIISQYLPLLVLTTAAEIVLDIVLMWQGYWRKATRFASLCVNLASVGLVLFLLWQHDTWLAAQGMAGIMTSIGDLPTLIIERNPLAGMVAFRVGLVFALPVVAYEAAMALYSFVRALTTASASRAKTPKQSTSR